MIASGIFFTGASDVAIQNDVLSRRTLNAAVEAELESRGLRAYPNQAVTVYVDGEQYEGTTLLIDGTTFVGIREFTMLCEDATVEWVGAEKAVYVTNPRVAIKAVNSTDYVKRKILLGREGKLHRKRDHVRSDPCDRFGVRHDGKLE